MNIVLDGKPELFSKMSFHFQKSRSKVMLISYYFNIILFKPKPSLTIDTSDAPSDSERKCLISLYLKAQEKCPLCLLLTIIYCVFYFHITFIFKIRRFLQILTVICHINRRKFHDGKFGIFGVLERNSFSHTNHT